MEKFAFFLALIGLAAAKNIYQNNPVLENILENVSQEETASDDETKIQTGSIVYNSPRYLVGLKYKNGGNFCTATLISQDRILTAAHCTGDNIKGYVLQAVMGLSDITTESVNRWGNHPNVSAVDFTLSDVVNADYIGPSNDHLNDLSIIYLRTPMKSVFQPIMLASNDWNYRRDLKGMGWGFHNCTTTSQEALREAQGTYVDNNSCSSRWRKNIPDTQVCMFYRANNVAAAVAPGDSGGPIVSLSWPNYPVQIGIASYVGIDTSNGYEPGKYVCVDKNRPQIYTRVSSFYYFIKRNAPQANFVN